MLQIGEEKTKSKEVKQNVLISDNGGWGGGCTWRLHVNGTALQPADVSSLAPIEQSFCRRQVHRRCATPATLPPAGMSASKRRASNYTVASIAARQLQTQKKRLLLKNYTSPLQGHNYKRVNSINQSINQSQSVIVALTLAPIIVIEYQYQIKSHSISVT